MFLFSLTGQLLIIVTTKELEATSAISRPLNAETLIKVTRVS
jgi:hypothetical protein